MSCRRSSPEFFYRSGRSCATRAAEPDLTWIPYLAGCDSAPRRGLPGSGGRLRQTGTGDRARNRSMAACNSSLPPPVPGVRAGPRRGGGSPRHAQRQAHPGAVRRPGREVSGPVPRAPHGKRPLMSLSLSTLRDALLLVASDPLGEAQARFQAAHAGKGDTAAIHGKTPPEHHCRRRRADPCPQRRRLHDGGHAGPGSDMMIGFRPPGRGSRAGRPPPPGGRVDPGSKCWQGSARNGNGRQKASWCSVRSRPKTVPDGQELNP